MFAPSVNYVNLKFDNNSSYQLCTERKNFNLTGISGIVQFNNKKNGCI